MQLTKKKSRHQPYVEFSNYLHTDMPYVASFIPLWIQLDLNNARIWFLIILPKEEYDN